MGFLKTRMNDQQEVSSVECLQNVDCSDFKATKPLVNKSSIFKH